MKTKLEEVISEIIDERVALAIENAVSPKPVNMITIDQAAELCGDVDRGTIVALVDRTDETGFPAIRLGVRTVRIDRKRLMSWLEDGGLLRAAKTEDRRSLVVI